MSSFAEEIEASQSAKLTIELAAICDLDDQEFTRDLLAVVIRWGIKRFVPRDIARDTVIEAFNDARLRLIADALRSIQKEGLNVDGSRPTAAGDAGRDPAPPGSGGALPD